MTAERIYYTKLWSRTLGRKDDIYEERREELRSSFLSFRENSAFLVSKISAALPGLTQHDISHLDALWEVADLICGDNYPLNPLEAYVFGGAVLLHDSALCFEAYENGIDGVRDTITWKDSFANLPKNIGNDEAVRIADFSALRILHAHQAERLTEKSWADPETGDPLFLIENSTLRKHLGKLIGQIAASHHWSIEDVANKLPNQVNVLPGFPRDWRIDPVKIACMLRCADAAHIDSERAPDFLHALIKKRGISLAHWKAQNKLASVDIDQSDSSHSTLLFTSTHKFLEYESDAWWVAYDTVCMIDKEIRSSNALLESRQIETLQFQAKRVKGIESPELMAKYIQTEGWSPCSAEIHVGNVESLVTTLGGEKLYGEGCDKLEVIIRELIQNARDSIHARREIDSGFSGKISISLEKCPDGYHLCVKDDGVGMTKRVLTGPLLDFGTSFWSSSLVQSEFPGLRSSKFRAVGQFGIGFYSVFMGSDKVVVSSKPWNGGSSDVWQLIFNSGLSLRPLLKNIKPDDFGSGVSTQVKLLLRSGVLSDHEAVEVKRNLAKAASLQVGIDNYIAAICAALDVSVVLKINNSDYTEIHTEITRQEDHANWLKRISFSASQSPSISSYIDSNIDRLRPIVDENGLHGLAAISIIPDTEQNFLSIKTVGSLSSGIHCRSGEDYMGYVNYLPQSAKREGLKFSASSGAIKKWAKEQVEILIQRGINPLEKCYLAYSLASFEVDPVDVANVLLFEDEAPIIVSIEDLARMSTKQDIIFIKPDYIDHVDTHTQVRSLPGKTVFCPLRNSNFLSLKLKDGKPESNNSILGCLYRKVVELGYVPNIRIEKTLVLHYLV